MAKIVQLTVVLVITLLFALSQATSESPPSPLEPSITQGGHEWTRLNLRLSLTIPANLHLSPLKESRLTLSSGLASVDLAPLYSSNPSSKVQELFSTTEIRDSKLIDALLYHSPMRSASPHVAQPNEPSVIQGTLYICKDGGGCRRIQTSWKLNLIPPLCFLSSKNSSHPDCEIKLTSIQ